jgi:hypothetical protein
MATTTMTPTRSAQRSARWVLVAAIVLAALYVALPVVLVLDLDAVRATVQAESPALDAHGVDVAVRAVVAYSAILHAVSVAVLLWFTVQTLKGRRWARIALSVFLFLIVATVASFASWSAGLQFQWSVIATDALHVLMIALLWLPGRSRRAHRQECSGDDARPGTQEVGWPAPTLGAAATGAG